MIGKELRYLTTKTVDVNKVITRCLYIGFSFSQIFRYFQCYINNRRHLARKYARIFVRGHYLFREANSFPRAKLEENCELRGTDNVQGQIFEHISAPNGDYCLYYPSNLFRNARSFENWGIYNNYSMRPSWIWSDKIITSYPTRANGIIVLVNSQTGFCRWFYFQGWSWKLRAENF